MNNFRTGAFVVAVCTLAVAINMQHSGAVHDEGPRGLQRPLGGDEVETTTTSLRSPPESGQETRSQASEEAGHSESAPPRGASSSDQEHSTERLWRDNYDKEYADRSLPEIQAALKKLNGQRRERLLEQFNTRLQAGQFVEVLQPNALDESLVPQSDTPGEALRQYKKTHIHADGSMSDRWVFIQPSELPADYRSIEREWSYLVIRAQELGAPLPPHVLAKPKQE